MARLFLAGPVLNPQSPEDAEEDVKELMNYEPDWTRIRVDDARNLREIETVYLGGEEVEM